MSSFLLTRLSWLVLLSLCHLTSSQTSTSPSFFTPATINVQAPSAAAVAKLKKYQQFVVLYLEGQSFDHLFGTYPGANGIPKARLAYRPQVDFSGNVLTSLPPCSNADPSTCGFPSGLPNLPFEGSQYIPLNATTPFDSTQSYYTEQFQLNGGLSTRYATPTTPGYPSVSSAGGWVMSYYNLSTSYLYQLAANYTLLDNHFHPSFGTSFSNHLYLISGRLPYFNNSATGCASQPNYVTAVDSTGSAFFANNSINRCTPDGKIFATTYPPSWPPQAYSPTSPTVLQGIVTSGSVPTTPVSGSPGLSFVMPPITSYGHIGDAMDARNVTWAFYAQYYNAVLSGNFSAAPGFAYDHLPVSFQAHLTITDPHSISLFSCPSASSSSFHLPITVESCLPAYGLCVVSLLCGRFSCRTSLSLPI